MQALWGREFPPAALVGHRSCPAAAPDSGRAPPLTWRLRAPRPLPPLPFADIRPGEWPYPALVALAEQEECGPPAQRRQLEAALPLNRWEAAALLEACQGARAAAPGQGEERARLRQEFAAERARLAERLGSLEARVTAPAARPFAPLSSLRGDVRWWIGSVAYGGNQIEAGANRYAGRPLRDALAFNQDVRFTVSTSFDGADLLRLRLRSGNGGFSPFRDTTAPTLRVSGLSPGTCEPGRFCRNDLIVLDKLYYQRPIGERWRVSAGSRVNQKDMLGLWPSLFDDNELMLSLFGKAGAPGAYSDLKGAGVGLIWKPPGRADRDPGPVLSAVYVASAAAEGDPAGGGLASAGGRAAGTLQAGWLGTGWAVAAAYTRNQAGALDSGGLAGFWQPADSGWIPAVNLGWGWNRNRYASSGANRAAPLLAAQSRSWMVGLNWFDGLSADSELGVAIGEPVYVTLFRNPAGERGAADGSLLMEAWYRFQASDWLTISPGVFWLPRPRGQLTAAGTSFDTTPLPLGRGARLSALGALLKLRFRV
ncbi:MAG: carbohydrate porin [Synechococcaceae cyanobacterium]|nr:carbohydrate porin [Synechococcaceae cyanobacterium]